MALALDLSRPRVQLRVWVVSGKRSGLRLSPSISLCPRVLDYFQQVCGARFRATPRRARYAAGGGPSAYFIWRAASMNFWAYSMPLVKDSFFTFRLPIVSVVNDPL